MFLKKLSQGCVMQLCSRQVADLYLTDLTIAQKIAVFYGTLNHFLILYVADRSVVLFTAMWTLFAVAQVPPTVVPASPPPPPPPRVAFEGKGPQRRPQGDLKIAPQGGGGVDMDARRRRGGGVLEKCGSVSGPLFCVRTDVGAKGAGIQILARKFFFHQ